MIHIHELRKMTDNIGKLLSMNSFFFTDFDRSLWSERIEICLLIIRTRITIMCRIVEILL